MFSFQINTQTKGSHKPEWKVEAPVTETMSLCRTVAENAGRSQILVSQKILRSTNNAALSTSLQRKQGRTLPRKILHPDTADCTEFSWWMIGVNKIFYPCPSLWYFHIWIHTLESEKGGFSFHSTLQKIPALGKGKSWLHPCVPPPMHRHREQITKLIVVPWLLFWHLWHQVCQWNLNKLQIHHQSHKQRLCLFMLANGPSGFPSVQVPKLGPKASLDRDSLQALWQHLQLGLHITPHTTSHHFPPSSQWCFPSNTSDPI